MAGSEGAPQVRRVTSIILLAAEYDKARADLERFIAYGGTRRVQTADVREMQLRMEVVYRRGAFLAAGGQLREP